MWECGHRGSSINASGVASALSRRIEIRDPASTRFALPAVLDDHAHAFGREIFNLIVKFLRRSDGIAERTNPVTTLAQAVTPELASVYGLNPFDVEPVEVRGHLFCTRRDLFSRDRSYPGS